MKRVPRDGSCIALGDYVIITGGGLKRMVAVQAGSTLRLGSAGYVRLDKLVGMRFGEVVQYDQKKKTFVSTNAYPDLDITNVEQGADETRDNRHIIDDSKNQNLSSVELATLRQGKGIDEILSSFVEKKNALKFKTAYSQEKYLRRKNKRYGMLYKVERVTLDGLVEIYMPTICPADVELEEARVIRLRADTLALILHHSNVCSGSRVLVYDKTNGLLEAALLSRLGTDGLVLQVMDKTAQPVLLTAQAMGLERVLERWKAVPRNKDFLFGVDSAEEQETKEEANKKNKKVLFEDDENGSSNDTGRKRRKVENSGGVSQWLKGVDARQMLMERPADSLIVATDDDAESVVSEMLPFLALGGRVVVYSPYLEDMTGPFAKLWNKCKNICVSETWYRHHQLLPNRTHPTVNMNTAGGYLLTAIKSCSD